MIILKKNLIMNLIIYKIYKKKIFYYYKYIYFNNNINYNY